MNYLSLLSFSLIALSLQAGHPYPDYYPYNPDYHHHHHKHESLVVALLLSPFRAARWVAHGTFAITRDFSGGIAIAGGIVTVVAGVGWMMQSNKSGLSRFIDAGVRAKDNLFDRNQEKHFIMGNLDKITLLGAAAFALGGIVHLLTKGAAQVTAGTK